MNLGFRIGQKKLQKTIRHYFINYRPKVYLFDDDMLGEAINTRTAKRILASSKLIAKVNKKGGIYSLLHSYATYLLEGGTDFRDI